MPAIICDSPQGQTYQFGDAIPLSFTVEPPTQLPTSWWQRDCANGPNSQPEFALPVNLPTVFTDVSTRAQLVSAIQDTSIEAIRVTGNIGGTYANRIVITGAHSTGSNRYITAPNGRTIPPIHWNGARNWVVTDATMSPSMTSGTAAFYVNNSTDITVDRVTWRPTSGRSAFFVANNAGFNTSTVRPTVQRCTVVYNAATQHRESVAIGSGGHLSDNPYSVWNGQPGQANIYEGLIEDFKIYDNYVEEAGDGVQITTVSYAERATPGGQEPYWEADYPGLHIAGNTFTTVNNNENAIDIKASSRQAARPAIVEYNFCYGYNASADGPSQSDAYPAAIVVHQRPQEIIIRKNIIYDCVFAISATSWGTSIVIEDNLAVNCTNFFSGDAYFNAAYDRDNLNDALSLVDMSRNVWVRGIGGGGTAACMDVGISSSSQVVSKVTGNCNLFDNANISPISGSNWWGGPGTVQSFTGADNVSRAASNVSGITGGSTYQNRMSNITMQLGECGGSAGSISIKGLVASADVPAACTSEFMWTQ